MKHSRCLFRTGCEIFLPHETSTIDYSLWLSRRAFHGRSLLCIRLGPSLKIDIARNRMHKKAIALLSVRSYNFLCGNLYNSRHCIRPQPVVKSNALTMGSSAGSTQQGQVQTKIILAGKTIASMDKNTLSSPTPKLSVYLRLTPQSPEQTVALASASQNAVS